MKVDARTRSAGSFAAGLTAVGLLVAGAPAVAQAAGPADVPTYLRASVKTGGGQPSPVMKGNLNILHFSAASVSNDGRFTVFSSNAVDLVPGDTNESEDVFLRDSVNDVTTRISVSSSGEESAGGSNPHTGAHPNDSENPSMSADGRYIVFSSYAANLVPGDTNNTPDVFLRDVVAGVTTRVNLAQGGKQVTESDFKRFGASAAISPDGRFVVFESSAALIAGDTDRSRDVYLRELATGRTVRISETYNGQPVDLPASTSGYDHLAVTSGGRHVVFLTSAANLIPGDTIDTDVFVRDVVAGTTVRASVTESGKIDGSPSFSSMSADGRYVAFGYTPDSWEDRLDRVYVRDLVEKTTTLVSVRNDGTPVDGNFPSISPDGRYVVFRFADDTGFEPTIFVHDRDAHTTRPVNVWPSDPARPVRSYGASLSANGRHLAFESELPLVREDTNLNEDVFVRLNVL